ncbi:hypothetical protein Tco_1283300 [Tanacetum coccineum]
MGSFHLYADVARKERMQFKRTGQPILTKVNTNLGVSQKNRMGTKSFVAAVQQGSHDSWSRNQVYVQKKNDNYVEKQVTCNNSNSPCLVNWTLELSDDVCLSLESSKSSFLARAVNIQIIHRLHSILEIIGFTSFHIRYIRGRWGESLAHGKVCVLSKLMSKIKEGIHVKVNKKYYDVLIFEFAYWAPDFQFDDDCESNESDYSDGKNSDTSSNPKGFKECYTEQPVHKSVQEQSESDPFNLMGLIEKQGINLVKKDKETMINRDTDKEMEQPIHAELNKDQGNECQDGSCNEQRIDNNVRLTILVKLTSYT